MKKHIEVVAAVIYRDGKYLAVQRGKAKYDYVSYKWEFPGGKVEPGESLESALQRELKEELKIEISGIKLLTTVKHEYPDFHITMHCFLCQLKSSEITLIEHINLAWLTLKSISTIELADADKKVIRILLTQTNIEQ
ncbi:(deoxy)nucleoside triphosphate pyrophosphohydrolase [Celerinatantimonas sp. MCCC 1A17872]|uniref:(deoxy)nucleoside triphosphate pyrophosphohydrolase n=1 Tax=Celerinatantimonas sp. MCCC 1A17872 TaxID=3177514 RepID=UPI0038CA53AF